MREILFKAKRIDNGEWVEGYLIRDNFEGSCRIIIKLEYSTGTSVQTAYAPRVHPETICQFTGLHDKNGNKIWENDICNYCENEIEHTDNCVIRFGEYSFNGDKSIGFFTEWIKFHDVFREDLVFWTEERELEVIGNIFDNPELLKGVF